MAQFDANISILVNAQKAFAVVEKLENKLSKLQNKATKTQVGAVVREDKQAVTRAEKLLENEVRLVAAKQRRATIDKALQRAGAGQDKASAKRIADLRKASDAAEDNLGIQNSVNAALEKELQVRREINRTDRAKAKVQRDVAGYNKRINLLGDTGQTDSALKEVRKLRDELNKLNDAGSVDLAKTVDAKLQQKLKLLERANTVTRPGSLSGGARSPVGGSTTTPGSPKYIEAQANATAKAARELDKVAVAEQRRNQALGGARSPVGGSAETPGSPKYIQAQAAANTKAAQALEKVAAAEQKRKQAVGGARSPIRGSANTPGSPKYVEAQAKAIEKLAKAGGPSSRLADRSVLGSDDAIRAKAKYYDQIATSVKAISSPMRAQSVLGSDSALRKKAEYYERIAKSTKTTVGARSPIRGSANIPGSPKYVEAAARAEGKKAKAAERTAKATERTAKATERTAKAAKAETKAKGKGKGQGALGVSPGFSNVAAGVGFPLLFGGGPGSVIGGGLGAILGGFGGSIIGGALGQQLDALGAAALSTADAFGKLGATANELVPKLGRGASGGFGGRAEFLIGEGRSSQVADILRERFDEVYGPGAVKEFEDLSKSSSDLKNIWTELGIQLQRLSAGPLKGLVETLKGIADRDKPANKEAFAAQAAYNKIRDRNRAAGADASKDDLAAEANALAQVNKVKGVNLIGPELTDQIVNRIQVTAAEEKLIELAKQEKSIQNEINEAKLAAVSQALTARRDDLAALTTAVGITKTLADLDKTRAQLTAERARSTKDIQTILQLEKTEAEQAADLERQRIAQANAVALAERQIRQESRNLTIKDFELQQQITNEKAKFNSLSATEKKQYDIKIALLEEQYQTAIDVLTVQEAVALEGKNEIGIRNQITESFKKQKDLAYERVKAQTLEVYQGEVLRQDRLQAIKDQEKLNKLTAENAAIRAIDSNDPERTASFSGAGLGFFADSALLEANVIRDSAAQLEEYNVQIAALQKRIKELAEGNFDGINDGRLTIKQEQLDRLTQTRNLYEQLQPAIDAARIKQAQFNDALAAVTPGVNALVGGLRDVIAGTKTAEEAFADFLNTVADQLIQTAATMIAQYIAIGIAKAFAFGGNSAASGAQGIGAAAAGGIGIPGLATGGTAKGGKAYVVGESGPELFIPGVTGTVSNNDQFEAARNALMDDSTGDALIENEEALGISSSNISSQGGNSSSSNSSSNDSSTSNYYSQNGSALAAISRSFAENNNTLSSTSSVMRDRSMERESENTTSSAGKMTIETQVINEVEYATVDQVAKASALAAKQARAQVFSDMKNKPSRRAAVGMR